MIASVLAFSKYIATVSAVRFPKVITINNHPINKQYIIDKNKLQHHKPKMKFSTDLKYNVAFLTKIIQKNTALLLQIPMRCDIINLSNCIFLIRRMNKFRKVYFLWLSIYAEFEPHTEKIQ